MSKGMQQRLGIAQALVGSRPSSCCSTSRRAPSIRSAAAPCASCSKSCARRGVAVLLNSHLLSEVELVCDRVTIIAAGERRRRRGPAELARPRGVEIETDEGVKLFADAARDDTPSLVAELVGAGRSVYGVSVLRSTLEEVYLEAVDGETDDVRGMGVIVGYAIREACAGGSSSSCCPDAIFIGLYGLGASSTSSGTWQPSACRPTPTSTPRRSPARSRSGWRCSRRSSSASSSPSSSLSAPSPAMPSAACSSRSSSGRSGGAPARRPLPRRGGRLRRLRRRLYSRRCRSPGRRRLLAGPDRVAGRSARGRGRGGGGAVAARVGVPVRDRERDRGLHAVRRRLRRRAARDDRPRARSDTLSHSATVASWALPFEALYQDALRQITSHRSASPASCSGSARSAAPTMAAGESAPGHSVYLLLVGAATLAAFARRDLQRRAPQPAAAAPSLDIRPASASRGRARPRRSAAPRRPG